MKLVHLKLTEQEAEVVHTALLHTRREYLGAKEREKMNIIMQALRSFEREPSNQALRAQLRGRLSFA